MSTLKVTYLNHSGFLVETAGWCLVFDYFPEGAAEGVLRREDFPAEKKLAVFISHSRSDHFSPEALALREVRPDLLLFAGDDVPLTKDAQTVLLSGGDQMKREEIQVTALTSTDLGVAFVVEADGLLLYHAGDLNDWVWAGEPDADNAAMSSAYRAQMEKIAGMTFDAAFLPMDPRQEEDYLLGILGFWEVCRTKHLFPMHFWGDYSVFDKMEKDSRADGFRSAVHRISHRGEVFHLAVGDEADC